MLGRGGVGGGSAQNCGNRIGNGHGKRLAPSTGVTRAKVLAPIVDTKFYVSSGTITAALECQRLRGISI